MRSVSGTERVVYENFRKGSKFFRARGVVLFFFRAWKRTFSRSMMSPSLKCGNFSLCVGTDYVFRKITSLLRSSVSFFATGARVYFLLNSPFGLPRCEQRITLAPCSDKYLMVGALQPILFHSFAVFHGNVKITSCGDSFSFNIDILNCLLLYIDM